MMLRGGDVEGPGQSTGFRQQHGIFLSFGGNGFLLTFHHGLVGAFRRARPKVVPNDCTDDPKHYTQDTDGRRRLLVHYEQNDTGPGQRKGERNGYERNHGPHRALGPPARFILEGTATAVSHGGARAYFSRRLSWGRDVHISQNLFMLVVLISSGGIIVVHLL